MWNPPKGHPQVLRTGAAHPLPNFSGCGRTRRTRSNEAPDLDMELVEKIHDGVSICIISNAIFVKTGLEKLIITRFTMF